MVSAGRRKRGPRSSRKLRGSFSRFSALIVGVLPIGGGHHHQLVHAPDVPARANELNGQIVQQLRVRRVGALRPEVVHRLYDAIAEVALPHAVDIDAGCQGMLGVEQPRCEAHAVARRFSFHGKHPRDPLRLHFLSVGIVDATVQHVGFARDRLVAGNHDAVDRRFHALLVEPGLGQLLPRLLDPRVLQSGDQGHVGAGLFRRHGLGCLRILQIGHFQRRQRAGDDVQLVERAVHQFRTIEVDPGGQTEIAGEPAVGALRKGCAGELVVVDLDRPFLPVHIKVHAPGVGIAVIGRGDVDPTAGRNVLFGGDLQHFAWGEMDDAVRQPAIGQAQFISLAFDDAVIVQDRG